MHTLANVAAQLQQTKEDQFKTIFDIAKKFEPDKKELFSKEFLKHGGIEHNLIVQEKGETVFRCFVSDFMVFTVEDLVKRFEECTDFEHRRFFMVDSARVTSFRKFNVFKRNVLVGHPSIALTKKEQVRRKRKYLETIKAGYIHLARERIDAQNDANRREAHLNSMVDYTPLSFSPIKKMKAATTMEELKEAYAFV